MLASFGYIDLNNVSLIYRIPDGSYLLIIDGYPESLQLTKEQGDEILQKWQDVQNECEREREEKIGILQRSLDQVTTELVNAVKGKREEKEDATKQDESHG